MSITENINKKLEKEKERKFSSRDMIVVNSYSTFLQLRTRNAHIHTPHTHTYTKYVLRKKG